MLEVCINFIRKSVEESTAVHIAVVTHHLPTLQVVAPHHKGSVLNSAFAGEYGDLIADNDLELYAKAQSIPTIFALKDTEKEHIHRALKQANSGMSDAARLLELYRRMKDYGML